MAEKENNMNESNFVMLLEQARKDRVQAQRCFTQATDPELKDQALKEYNRLDNQYSTLLQESQKTAIKAVPIQLDLFPEYEQGSAAMPNTIARSALFAPVCRGRRKNFKEHLVTSRQDITLRYTGEQLDMSDSDVFLQAIRLANDNNVGGYFQIQPYAFLSAMGRGGKRKKVYQRKRKSKNPEVVDSQPYTSVGKVDLEWLRKSLKRLKTGVLTIDTPKHELMLSLIDEYDYEKETETHYLRFNPKIVKLFQKEQYGLIDWQKRQEIGVDLGKWMQTYIASNKKGPQVISIAKLKAWSGQKSRRTDHFKKTLNKALGELEDLKIIAEHKTNANDVLTYIRL